MKKNETRAGAISRLQKTIPDIKDPTEMRAELTLCNLGEIKGFMSLAGIARHQRELKPALIETIIDHYFPF